MARAGRFGTKGLAVTFVSDETDAKILNDVQDRFEVNVAELPEEIDISTYSESSVLCFEHEGMNPDNICFQMNATWAVWWIDNCNIGGRWCGR